MSRSHIRVDAHQHFWNYEPHQYGWIDDRMNCLRRNFLPDELSSILEKNQIDACIAVQARQSAAETEWLIRLGEDSDFIAGVVGWVDIRSNDIETMLAEYSRQPLLRGFRHVLQSESDQFMLDTKFLSGLKRLFDFDYSYDLLIQEQQLPAVLSLIDRLPECRLVLDHIAKPDILNGSWASWADHMRSIAERPNVYCKISGMVTEADWQKWDSTIFARYMDHVFACFGADRLMFGSDWPVCTVAATYSEVLNIVESYITGYGPDAIEAIMGGTAKTFYRL